MNYRGHIPSRRWQTNEVSSLSSSVTARITLFDRSIIGFREVDSLGSILRVRAAPFVELEKATINGNFVAYVIDAPRLYAGHGRVSTRNMGDRIDVEAARASQVYVIYSGDPRFDSVEKVFSGEERKL